MLKLVTNQSDIEKYQKFLETTLKKVFSIEEVRQRCKLNHDNPDIWYSTGIWKNSFVNEFGFLSDLNDKNQRKTIVIFSIRSDNKVAAGFALDSAGNINLIHKGKFCQEQKQRFFDWYRKQPLNLLGFVEEKNKRKEVIVIGAVDSDSFIDNLTQFIKHVATFKSLTHENEFNDNEIESFLEHVPNKFADDFEGVDLKKVERIIFVHKRDEQIKKRAKEIANGICQLCDLPAPFKKENEKGELKPYLEVHHVIRLADGGADSIKNVVALCPNCHRKMHILNLEEDVKKLRKIAKLNR
ncbi:MAG: HNH endonuclease [Methylococcales bacterium]|nr:HNH endonuclease [Methylococcales bacterium]